MIRQIPLIPLLEKFIKESETGTRRKLNGQRLLPRSVENYHYVLSHLRKYEATLKSPITIMTNIRNNLRLIRKQKEYWKSFYRHFSDYLLVKNHFYDNYAGSLFKTLKCFFRYLKHDKYLLIPECYERFYVRKEEIRVISLLPEQFCFLIQDKTFEERLSRAARQCKDQFVFGCTGALRYSDLKRLKVNNIEKRGSEYHLVLNTLKTNSLINIKLPQFAIDIFEKYSRRKKGNCSLFKCTAISNFNKQIKKIGLLAGWTNETAKTRTRNGVMKEIQRNKKPFRFCDQLSSHVMRKTGITVLLMLGMPEYLVRKISGHSPHSAEFYRYVNFAQSYISEELDKAHQNLISLYQ